MKDINKVQIINILTLVMWVFLFVAGFFWEPTIFTHQMAHVAVIFYIGYKMWADSKILGGD